MLIGGRRAGRLREWVRGGQFPGQKGGIGWRLEKIVGRKGDGRIREGQSRTRKEKVFHGPGLFEAIKRTQRPGLLIGLQQW